MMITFQIPNFPIASQTWMAVLVRKKQHHKKNNSDFNGFFEGEELIHVTSV